MRLLPTFNDFNRYPYPARLCSVVRRKTYKNVTGLAIQLSSANGISKVTDLLLKHDYRIENISVKTKLAAKFACSEMLQHR